MKGGVDMNIKYMGDQSGKGGKGGKDGDEGRRG